MEFSITTDLHVNYEKKLGIIIKLSRDVYKKVMSSFVICVSMSSLLFSVIVLFSRRSNTSIRVSFIAAPFFSDNEKLIDSLSYVCTFYTVVVVITSTHS